MSRRDSGHVYSYGRLGKLRVTVRPDSIRVSGSLHKFKKGNNILEFTQSEVASAINDIERDLSLDLSAGKVYRIDLGYTLVVPHPPSVYLRSLSSAPRYEKRTYGHTSVLFVNTERTISLYDKTAEAKSRREVLPPELEAHHLLRVEVQLKKRIRRQIGFPLSADMLGDPSVWHALRGIFLKHIRSLRFKPTYVATRDFVYKDLHALALSFTIKRLGEDHLIMMIDEARREGLLTKDKACRHKRKIRQIGDSSPKNFVAMAKGDEFREIVQAHVGVSNRDSFAQQERCSRK